MKSMPISIPVRVASVASVVAFMLCLLPAGAQTVAAPPSPSPSPTPSASPTPRPLGLQVSSSASLTFVSQGSAGSGVVGPEAPGFAAGAPLAPNTPYDFFSSAPLVPGNAGVGQVVAAFTYGAKAFDVGITAGAGYVNGSVTNASYWTENLMPGINPHLGSQALPYAVTFPAHAGNDDARTARLAILAGSIATADGKLRVRGGWFDLAQTDRFVFAAPALTNANPAIAYAPVESLTSGVAGSDTWQPLSAALPLQGVDAVAKSGNATLELTSAALPSLPGESARMTMGSIVFDRGKGTRLSAQVVHAATSGISFVTTVPFGTNPTFVSSPQGVLPLSTLSGQEQTIAGARAAFHVLPRANVDGVLEIGRAWYDASPAAQPGTSAPGGYYHAGVSARRGRATVFADVYRMEPRYATMILPYGIAENQWSVAFAWPGQWLKSNYQLIDNSVLGVNRQGYRLRYYVDHGPLEMHTEYTDLRQIDPETTVTAEQIGFVDGYYLPQLPPAATFGRQKRYAFWGAWHPRFGDISLDVVYDTLSRPSAPAHPEDVVAYVVPQAVLTFSRSLSPSVTGALGIGCYAMNGAFAERIDFAERLFFAGVQIRQSSTASLLVTFRRTAVAGLSTFPAFPRSPNFTASTLIVEQRVSFAR